MARRKNLQTPLGELLTKARLDKGLTRGQLAKEIGIGENSLARYEKAGIEEDGQYPPSPKLAKLCFFLGLSPTSALFGCLENDYEYDHYRMQSHEDWVMEHPDHDYLLDQWFAMVEDNFKLSNLVKLLLSQEPEPGSREEYFLQWVKKEGQKVVEVQDAFYDRLVNAGKQPAGTPLRTFANSPTLNLWDYADFKRNGPDQEDPDRTYSNPTNPETAPTVSSDTDINGGDK